MTSPNQERRAAVWVALPAFNEEPALGPLLDRLLNLGLRGLIVSVLARRTLSHAARAFLDLVKAGR